MHALTLDNPAPVARAMLWSIALFSLTMLGWAGWATLPETATAEGRVVPSRALQQVSHLEGGVVTAILVKPGDKVRAGQLLLRLDPGLAGADVGRTNAATQALQARIARLEAEVSGRAPVFPVGLEITAPAIVAAERSLWAAHGADQGAASAGESARLDGALQALAQAKTERRREAEARAQAAREVAIMAPLVDKGIEPEISLDRARSALAQADAAVAGAGQAAARAAASVAEARAAMRGVNGRSRTAAGDALAAARAELAGQRAGMPALQNRVDRSRLRAPVSGTVNRVLVATVGGSVRGGEPLVEIVPGGDTLVVDARLNPRDIAFVHPGQPAQVRLTAYDSAVYGALHGRVERISADAVTNERTGESHYQVRIVTDAKGLRGSDGRLLPVAAGMVAEVSLTGRQRSILSYLAAPVMRLQQQAFRER